MEAKSVQAFLSLKAIHLDPGVVLEGRGWRPGVGWWGEGWEVGEGGVGRDRNIEQGKVELSLLLPIQPWHS